jgi:ATP-binding cassette subfamily B protein
MRNKQEININRQLLVDCRKAVVWSFKFAWNTSRRLLLSIVSCFLFEAIIPVAATASIGILVSKLKEVDPQHPLDFSTLAFWLGLAIGLLTLEFILIEVRNFSRQRLADETGVVLQTQMYQHSSRMDLAFFEKGETLNRLFRATGNSTGAVGPIQSTLSGVSGLIQIVSLFGLMVYLQPFVAVLLFVAGIPLLIVRSYSAIDKYKLDVQVTQRRRWSRYYSSLLTGDENIPATKLLRLAPEIIKRFQETAWSIVDERRMILEKISIRLSICVLFYMLVLVFAIGWLTFDFSQGGIAAGALAAFMLSAFRALKSHAQIASAMATGAESALAIIPFLEFRDVEPEISDQDGLSLDDVQGEIVLDKVCFAYPGSELPIMRNFSLVIPAGQKVAIVGGNGAGKSTLIKLIARLYEVDSGSIKVDGHDIKELSLEWLHGHIAMVFQKPTRFEASLHENIAFGDWQNLKDQPEYIRKITDKMGLTDFIEQLPQGFDTHLGRMFGQVTLSAGQWQRLAVARALCRKDSVLILDEPTSNLDSDAEMSMFHAIRELADERTVIFISHKFTTVKEADRILVLENGSIVEDGTHEQLTASGGFYANMVKHQKGEMA